MNKSVTEGIEFMPPPFIDGLQNWSREDGTNGTATYDSDATASVVADDPDFRSCLQFTKTESTQRLRCRIRTPIPAECYVRIRVRLKVVSGSLPGVRIAARAERSDGSQLAGVAQYGPTTQIDRHGEVIVIDGYAGAGGRRGVDMPWGAAGTHGRFGFDLTGENGAVIRVDDIEITDATNVFLRDMLDIVDIRDFGAIGDGFTDDTDALEAADAAADGRVILVPNGTFRIERSVTIASPIRFHGTLAMPDEARLQLLKSFDLPTYIEAFGDETRALQKALQALFNHTDHESLDMGGRRVQTSGPIDVAAAIGGQPSFSTRRILRNGQIDAQPGVQWDPIVVSMSGSYSPSQPTSLTGLATAAAIPVGAHVTGQGVGREVYVKRVDAGAGKVELSVPLYGAAGVQDYTFTRYRYMLDFSGFQQLRNFVVDSVELRCNGVASGILLPPEGGIFQFREGAVYHPKDRGITSHGIGCQGLVLDGNQFQSGESSVAAQDRTSVMVNVNANDTKIRDNRATRFRHFAVLGGAGHLIAGNHWFQGDGTDNGVRLGGIIFTSTNLRTVVSGNYIDNSTIEWTNEHHADPDQGSGYTFGGLTVTGNTFMCSHVLGSFRWIVVKPYGQGHTLAGVGIIGNVFRTVGGAIDRFDGIDSSIGDLVAEQYRDVVVEGNTFNGVTQSTANPIRREVSFASPSSTWTVDFGDELVFDGKALAVTSIVPIGAIRNASDSIVYDLPYAQVVRGSTGKSIDLRWPQAVKGTVHLTVRADKMR